MKRIQISQSVAVVLLTTLVVGAAIPAFGNTSGLISARQFRNEIQGHRQRVLADSQLILDRYLSEFPALNSMPKNLRENILRSYVGLHDAPKIMTRVQLVRWRYENEKTIFQSLHEVYGTNLTERPQFIDDLNIIEGQIKDKMLEVKFGNLDESLKIRALKEVRYIEWIADITDTLHMRGPELGINLEFNSSEIYFRNRDDAKAARMARWLGEANYSHFMGHVCTGIFAK